MAVKSKNRKDIYETRIVEYVDSSRMRQRIKIGRTLSCTIDGNYGTYLTRVVLASNRVKESKCTCPSEYWPCKHVHALALTYQNVPDSFLDVEKILISLKGKTKEELLTTIRGMVETSPSCLKVLGVKGFEETSEQDFD